MRDKRKSENGTILRPSGFDLFYPVRSVLILMVMVIFVLSCEKYEIGNGSGADLMALAGIEMVLPENQADSAAIDQIISVTFKQSATSLKVSTPTITLKKGGLDVPGTTTYSGTIASFTPKSDLAPQTEYTATIKTAASKDGEDSEYSWRFRTGRHRQRIYPSVISVTPTNRGTNVAVETQISVTFDRDLTSQMMSAMSIVLKKSGSGVAGTISYSGKIATFTPSVSLSPNTLYYGIVRTGMSSSYSGGDDDDDDDDHNYGSSFYWSFTTGTGTTGSDVTAPSVSSVIPANNSGSVSTGSAVSVSFSENMNASTITSATILLKQGSVAVPGTVSYSGVVATFTPAAALVAGTNYTGTVTTGATDVAGNALAASYSWSFTTASAADVTAPTVQSVVPASNATSVATNSKVTANFSEAMNASTITSASFTLKQGTTAITGSISYSGTSAVFTPAAALAANTVYTATITTAAKDAAGNAIAANYTWSFTTAAVADVTAPTVTSVMPASNATSVAASSKVTANFSEAMNASTITSASFTLRQGTTNVSGTISYSGTSAVFTPAAALAASTVYTATITTAAKDVAGNAIAANYSWSFTTAAAADVTAPTVQSVAPASNAVSVAVNSKATVTFSEAMNSSTINSTSFTLKQGSTAVAGAVSYSGNTATFTPSAALAGNTVYTATVTTAVKDAAGNSLATAYSWSFTTIATVAQLSFAADVVPVLGLCNDCHTHGWTTSSNSSTFYTNLVSGGYLNTTTPTSSVIYSRVSGTHGGSSISAANRQKVIDWVNQGMKNN